MERHLAEPDDVRPQPGGAAGRAVHEDAHVVAPRGNRAAGKAAGPARLAVHVVHLPGAGPLVQVVDVLRAQEEGVAPRREPALQPGQRRMGGIGRGGQGVAPAHVVEGVDGDGVGREGLGRGELGGIEARPQAVAVPEGPEPALGRNAGAGEDEDPHRRAAPQGAASDTSAPDFRFSDRGMPTVL